MTTTPSEPSREPSAPRLVFGDDGSAAADVVWLWLNNHVWPGWHLSVVTAQPPDPLAPDPDADSSLHEWQPPVPRMLFEHAQPESLEYLTAAAEPRAVLEECAADADLIAVGPRGHGVLKAMHFGSTAEWLVSGDRPGVPVIIVRSARPIRQALVFVDGSAPAQRATEALAGLPWVGDCQVELVGITDGTNDPAAGLARAEETLTGIAAAVETKEAAAMRATLGMDAKSVIVDLVAETHPDLVVLGTRAQTGIKRLLMGSTAATVARTAACSVLVA